MAEPKLEQEVTQEVEEKDFDKVPLKKSIRFHPFQVDYANKEIVVQPSSIGQRLDLSMNNAKSGGGSILFRNVDMTSGDTTPSVKNLNFIETAGTTTITDFDDGEVGQLLLIKANTTITITHNASIIVLSGEVDFTMMDGNTLTLAMFDDQVWHEISRNVAVPTEKSWTFDSPAGGFGTFYFGGFYEFAATDDDFSGSPTFGTANSSRAAHFFYVLGATTVDNLTLRVTGTSIDNQGNRATSAIEQITFTNGTLANTYKETTKKWLGQVTITVVAGTAKTCNYGFTKYWDSNNSNFKIIGVEATWLGGANDASPNIKLRHHKDTGWTFNSGAAATPPTEVVAMATDHSTEDQVVKDENGAWKRDNLNEEILGGNGEGTIFEIVTTANKTFELGNLLLRVESQ